MRSKEDLEKLLIQIKGWFKQELGGEYSAQLLEEPMQLLLKKRYFEFLRKRIDHLPDADLINFYKTFSEDVATPVYVIEPKTEEKVDGGKKKSPSKKPTL